jgi:hypothetical protein
MQAGGKGVNGFLENTCIKITSKLYYYQNYKKYKHLCSYIRMQYVVHLHLNSTEYVYSLV